MFDVLYSTCVPFPSPRKDCAASQTQKPSVSKTLSDVCHTAHFIDLTTQTDAPDGAWEEEITGWDPRSTRDQRSSSSFWPHPSDATSRLGPDLMPPSRPKRTYDDMSVQEPETTHVAVAHPSASETIPPDVPVDLGSELEDSVQTRSTRRILFKRPRNPVDCVEPPKRTRDNDDDHSAPLSAHHHDLEKVSENYERWEELSSVEQGSLTCWTVLGLRLKTRMEHRKAKH